MSTDDQDMALQLDALAKVQCDRVFSEKASSGKERPSWKNVCAPCAEGCTHGMALGPPWPKHDRASRYRERSGLTWCDVRELNRAHRHIKRIWKICVPPVSALAEFERNTIKERTRAALQPPRPRENGR
ncbi:recombinase family protein [Xylella fastidiosa subsp. multiplex]|uniref:Recombinase family protein n=1 Tax=Xylella fastidiosa subsp. multiplex TaxID=644357 RepID=A0AAW6HYH8_XYLFS|nr:recombinase family protein [Xylella fastidiosa subsp. multiplex]